MQYNKECQEKNAQVFHSPTRLYSRSGGYFMDQQEEHAKAYEALLKRKEIERHLDGLKIEAQRLGAIFVELGQILQTSPEYVIFENVPAPAGINSPLFKVPDIDGNRIVALVNDIRTTAQELERQQELTKNLL
jgi:hypothetical protein